MGFSRQEYWSGLPFPSPGDLPDPGIEPGSPVLQTDCCNSLSHYAIARHILLLSYLHWLSPFKAGKLFHTLQWPNIGVRWEYCHNNRKPVLSTKFKALNRHKILRSAPLLTPFCGWRNRIERREERSPESNPGGLAAYNNSVISGFTNDALFKFLVR